jgi:hypothetical protein
MNRSPGTTQQKQALAEVREFLRDQPAILLARTGRPSSAKNPWGRDESKRTEAALGVWQLAAPAQVTLASGNDECEVIPSENERVQH